MLDQFLKETYKLKHFNLIFFGHVKFSQVTISNE